MVKAKDKEIEAGKEVLGCIRRVLIRNEEEIEVLKERIQGEKDNTEDAEKLLRAEIEENKAMKDDL